MDDEPRRSRRDNKGVNSKHVDDNSPPKTKPVKAKGSRKSVAQEEEEDEEEANAIIRCVCGKVEDDEGGITMICCDTCDAWQHNDCMGLPEDRDEKLSYQCEQCKPSAHKKLLAAMKRGERPWEDIPRNQQDDKKAKKGKKGRKSAVNEPTPSKSEKPATPKPVEASRDNSKRKHTTAETDEEQVPSKVRKSSALDRQGSESSQPTKKASSTPAPKQKKNAKASSTAAATPVPEPQEEDEAKPEEENDTKQGPELETPAAPSLADIADASRKGVATFLTTKFESQVKKLSQASQYRIPDTHTAKSLAEQLAIKVETAMFTHHCDPAKPDYGGPYKLQMTEIASNVTRNDELMLRVLNGIVTAESLATMSSDEMASEELQREMASMKEEADKQATLVQESGGPKMRVTHKGYELIEDPSAQAATEFSVSAAPAPRRRESDFPGSPTVGQDTVMTGTEESERQDTEDPTSAQERKASTNFDIKHVWNNVQSPEADQSARFAQSTITNHDEPTPVQQGEHDAEIDRLLQQGEDIESPPYSPGDDTDQSPIPWKGKVDMPNVGKFKAYARHVAGSDLSSTSITMADIFPESLTLSGRIHSVKADEYLSSLGAARNTDVIVHSIMPAEGADQAEATAQFDKLFRYFVDRDRWGVVNDVMHREFVTDTYIVPLDAGSQPMPQFLSRLAQNVIEPVRSRTMLLAVFVLKWRAAASAQAMPSSSIGGDAAQQGSMPPPPNGGIMSPLTAHPDRARQSSLPLPHHGNGNNNNNNNGQYSMPPNPYAAAPVSTAEAILGEYFTCPTAQEILKATASVPEAHLANLRRILENNPLARTDIAEFQRILNAS